MENKRLWTISEKQSKILDEKYLKWLETPDSVYPQIKDLRKFYKAKCLKYL